MPPLTQPPRPPAPHVQAAIARTAQAKSPPPLLSPSQTFPALSRNQPHQAASGHQTFPPAQPKLPPPVSRDRSPAPHVRAAVASVQTKLSAQPPKTGQPAAHLQAALKAQVQTKPGPAQGASPGSAPHLRAMVAQAKIAGAPQRAGARETRVVQPYEQKTIKDLGGAGRLSEGKKFFIPDNNGKIIWATEVPLYSKDAGQGSIDYQSRTYTAYEPKTSFLKDCLHTAEEIMAGAKLKTGSVRSSAADHGGRFGNSDEDNKKIAQEILDSDDIAHDQAAAPNPGQAYVILNMDFPDSSTVTYPYHAAAVAAQDGGDRVTIEVFASTTDAKNRDTTGDYQMYRGPDAQSKAGRKGKSFHSTWKGSFDNSVTFVIEKI